MRWEEWVELGRNLKNAGNLIIEGYVGDPRPKTRKKKWEKAVKLITQLKDVLDDIVFVDQPKLPVSVINKVFYGPEEPKLPGEEESG